MTTTMADQYFLKAKEGLFCQADESLENLHYALSYDAEHAPATLLMGQIIAGQLGDWNQAAAFVNQALATRPDDFGTCLQAAWFWMGRLDLDRVDGLVQHLKTLDYAFWEEIHFLESRVAERKGDLKAARKAVKQARLQVAVQGGAQFLESEDNRLKAKQKLLNPKRKKGKGKSKKAKKRKKSD
ncbi:MAG: hypothetical protein ACFB10_20175 [Salibacteraceae bacterium]